MIPPSIPSSDNLLLRRAPWNRLALSIVVLFCAHFGSIRYLGAAVLYADDFQSDTVGSNPAGWFASSGVPTYDVVVDPLDGENKVMSTSGGTNRTVSAMHSMPTLSSGGDIKLSLNLYLGGVGDANWNTKWYLQSGTMSNSAFFTSGYGFQLNQGSVQLQITTGSGISTDQGSATALASATVGSGIYNLSGWNEVVFLWTESGDLSLSVNGTILLTYNDTTYGTAFRTLKNTSFLNNSVATPGRVLYFDDLEVTSVPEPNLVWVLGALGFGMLCWGWKRGLESQKRQS